MDVVVNVNVKDIFVLYVSKKTQTTFIMNEKQSYNFETKMLRVFDGV